MAESRVFNDAVHGHIELDPLLMKVVDTPQFQRLRHIKQLGACYWVYPSATHNRFEHSLGTCHLASNLVLSLKNGLNKDFGIEITDKDIFLVSLAALCHDLGHGPLSHAFDGRFLRMLNKDRKHELLSVDMLDYLLEENSLKPLFKERFKDFNENDLEFVREQIRGPKNGKEYVGIKDSKKRFLYDIVSNKETGVDVDKFDYIARDCHHLGFKSTFDHWRYIHLAKVMKSDDTYKICIREKEARNIYELFHMRSILHDKAYQHKTCVAIEMMMTDALFMAKDYIEIKTKSGQKIKLEETIDHMSAFEHLTDNLIMSIRFSDDLNLQRSRKLLQRIDKREIYRQLVNVSYDYKPQLDVILQDFKHSDKISINYQTIDYGKKSANPVESYGFYLKSKQEMISLKREDVSELLPENFCEKRIRVFSKTADVEESNKLSEELTKILKESNINFK